MESDPKLKAAVESLGEVFWIADVLSSKMVYVSPASEKIWGSVPIKE